MKLVNYRSKTCHSTDNEGWTYVVFGQFTFPQTKLDERQRMRRREKRMGTYGICWLEKKGGNGQEKNGEQLRFHCWSVRRTRMSLSCHKSCRWNVLRVSVSLSFWSASKLTMSICHPDLSFSFSLLRLFPSSETITSQRLPTKKDHHHHHLSRILQELLFD